MSAMHLTGLTWSKKHYHRKMLRTFLLLVAVGWLGFLSGCARSNPKRQVSDGTAILEPAGGNEVHGEVGVMYGNNLGRR
jgi:hypothetical protein